MKNKEINEFINIVSPKKKKQKKQRRVKKKIKDGIYGGRWAIFV